MIIADLIIEVLLERGCFPTFAITKSVKAEIQKQQLSSLIGLPETQKVRGF